MKSTHDILLVGQRHLATRAGNHLDFRVVIGDKAFSWATKKTLPEPGGRPIILHEQPVHDAQYALTKEIIIPEGQYGAGRTYMEFAQRGKAEVDDTTYKLNLNNGTTYTIKKLPKLGEKSWLLMNTTKLEKKAQELKEEASPDALGIDLKSGKEPEYFKWLLASTLYGKPIQRSVAIKTYHTFTNEKITNPKRVSDAGWDSLVATLGRGHYVRYDFSTATKLLGISQHLKEHHGSSVKKLVEGSKNEAELRAKLEAIKGIGPLTSKIFVDGLKHAGVWNGLEKKALDLNGLEVDRHRYKEPRTDHLEKVTDPIGSIKYDGAAYFVPVSEDGSLRFISRKPSVTGTLLDRTEKLPHLASIKLPQFAGHVLHVELIHTGKTKGAPESHPAVSGILNSLTPKALRDQAEKGPVRAVLLDVIHPSVPTFSEKLKILKDIETSAGKPSLFFTPKTTKGLENITKLLDSSRSKGHEGVIITSLTKPEDKNTRYKVKHVGTYNLRVEGIAREKDKHGNPKDSMGALDVYDKTGRHVARVGTGFSKELRREIWENPYDWLYKIIQVKARKPTANKLRAPVYNGEADGELDKV